jgi:hypothetical protein
MNEQWRERLRQAVKHREDALFPHRPPKKLWKTMRRERIGVPLQRVTSTLLMALCSVAVETRRRAAI